MRMSLGGFERLRIQLHRVGDPLASGEPGAHAQQRVGGDVDYQRLVGAGKLAPLHECALRQLGVGEHMVIDQFAHGQYVPAGIHAKPVHIVQRRAATVDTSDFEEVLLFTRGASRREETVRELFGLWRRKIRFTNYERVVLYLRLKENIDSDSALDFEIDDALDKLLTLGLARGQGEYWLPLQGPETNRP